MAYYFSVILFLIIIFLNQQHGSQIFSSDKYYYLSLIVVCFWLVYIYLAGKYFEYDSEGSLVSLLNKGVILSEFVSYRTKIYEINKEKIKTYNICNTLFYRRLNVFYLSKTITKEAGVNISLLSPKKTRFLKLSLDKIISKTNLTHE